MYDRVKYWIFEGFKMTFIVKFFFTAFFVIFSTSKYAYASCGAIISETVVWAVFLAYLLAFIVFIKFLFVLFKAYKKHILSSAGFRRRASLYVILFLMLAFFPFFLRIAGFTTLQSPYAPDRPCCSALRVEAETQSVLKGRQRIREASHSAALCGCQICYGSEMFNPSLKIERLFDEDVLVEGKEYLLNNLYPAGTDINDFRRDLKGLGLKEVRSLCKNHVSDERYTAFHFYMNRHVTFGSAFIPNIILASHDAEGRMNNIVIEAVSPLNWYKVPEEVVQELAENNFPTAQEQLSNFYSPYVNNKKGDAEKSYFWYLVYNHHRAATMQSVPQYPGARPLLKEMWKKISSLSFKKKRNPRKSYLEVVGEHLSPEQMSRIQSEASKWWGEHKHIEFCTPANFQVIPEIKEYMSLSVDAEKGDPQAQYALGLLYQKGVEGIVRQNNEKARKWFSAAAAQNHEDARAVLESFEP